MVQPTYPGVYVEEVSSGVRPITAASTSTAAFIGQAQKGPIGEPVRIYNFTQFQDQYGDFLSGAYLAHAVLQFFNNGGGECYIVRVAEGERTADITLTDRHATVGSRLPSLTIAANSPGAWGNGLIISVSESSNDPTNEFKLDVYIGGEATPRESFDNLGMIPGRVNYVETVNNSSQYIEISVDTSNTNADLISGTSLGQGAMDLLGLAVEQTKLRINVNGDGYQEIDLQDAVDEATVPVANLSTAANVASAIQAVVTGQGNLPGLQKQLVSTPSNVIFTAFTAAQAAGVLTLTSGSPGLKSSVQVMPASNLSEDISWALKLGKSNSGTEAFGSAVLRPVVSANYLVGQHDFATDDAVDTVTDGFDGIPLIANDVAFTNAFSSLDNIDDVSLLAVPGRGSLQVINAGMNYCANRSLSDCFFIGDMAPDDDDVPDARAFAGAISPKNSYGAVYMPWLLGPDPSGVSRESIVMPPSGYVAGMYAKTDANRGVWKAPAGIESALAGTSGLVANLSDAEHGNLNPDPYNVNVIRQFKNAGRVIWGARTISSDGEYRYVPVRRMAIMLRVSLYRGTQWVVFEPNDEPLWAQIRLNIGAFMHNLFRQGAFQGKSPKEAYLVKCDAETTTQNDINQGIVNIIVGFAPLKPAEFVMIKIQQLAGQVEA